MESAARATVAYVVGIGLIGVAVAGLLPPVAGATVGVLGVGLMGLYALRVVRSGALGRRGLSPAPTTGSFGGGGSTTGDPHTDGGSDGGGWSGDGGWSGGDFGGGGGGDGGGGGGS